MLAQTRPAGAALPHTRPLSALARLIRTHPLATIIVAGLVVRCALTPLYAYLPNGLLDEGFWKHWMLRIEQDGVLNIFRSSDTDYVGYHWVLAALALVYGVIGGPYTDTTPSLHVLVKTPSILFDVLLIIAVYHAAAAVVREYIDNVERAARPAVPREAVPLVAAGIIAFQPAVLYDSAVWAQTDSAITAAMLGALLLAYVAKPAASGASFALGFMVKPHPVIIGPLLLLTLARHGGWRAIALALGAAAAVAAVVLGPWILHGDSGRIYDVYHGLFMPERFRLSELAFNGWWIADYLGDPRPGGAIFAALPALTWQRLAFTLSTCATLLAFAYAWRRPGLAALLIAAAYQVFAFYMLPVGSHERYMYPLLAFLLPVALIDRRWLPFYGAVSATFFINLITVAPPVPALSDRWAYSAFGACIGAVNVALFAGMTVVLARGVIHRDGQAQSCGRAEFPRADRSDRLRHSVSAMAGE